MIERPRDEKYIDDNRYYFTKTIEHDGEFCGKCKFSRNEICYFFGEVFKDTFSGKTKRHAKCLDAEVKEKSK